MIYNLKYTCHNGTSVTAKVNSLGAELVSFKKGDLEYIWVGDKEYWGGQNPVLFPVIGRVKGGKIRFSGVEYNLDKHGFARKSEFECVEHSDTKVTLLLKSTAETLSTFPFDFSLYISHEISENGFKTTYVIVNKDEKEMLCTIGGHPGFNIPLYTGEKFDDYKLVFEKTENAVVYYGDENVFLREDYVFSDILKNTNEISLNYPLFDRDALMCANLRSEKVSLINKQGKGVEMNFGGFPVLGVWTPPGKEAPFICLEPWYGLPSFANESGNFEDRPHIIRINPNGSKTLSYSVSVIE